MSISRGGAQLTQLGGLHLANVEACGEGVGRAGGVAAQSRDGQG